MIKIKFRSVLIFLIYIINFFSSTPVFCFKLDLSVCFVSLMGSASGFNQINKNDNIIVKHNINNIFERGILDIKDAHDIMNVLKENPIYFNSKELPNFSYDIPYPFGMWFRGTSKNNYDLTPSVFRKIYPESTLVHEFKLKNPEDHGNINNAGAFEWLTLAQHYSLPTRLLDWSESILTALYFAVDKFEQGSNGKLYILNAIRFNQYILDKEGFGVCPSDHFQVTIRAEMATTSNWKVLLRKKSIREHDDFPDFLIKKMKISGLELTNFIKTHNLDCPIAVMPVRSHERLIAQQGTFTIHGGINSNFRSLEKLNQECVDKGKHPFLFTLKVHNQQHILEQLKLVGINKGSIYRDKDSQSLHIKKLWEN